MKYKFVWIVALSAGLLSGCPSARPSKYYELTIPGNAAPITEPNPYAVTLLIAPLRASHLYREDRIVYSSGDQVGTYEYERWAQPPTEMLEELLLRDLRASGRYRSVDALRSNAHGDYILYGRLYDFKEVSGIPLIARLTFDLELHDTKTGSTVWTHYYTHDEPVAEKKLSAVVAALNLDAQHSADDIKASLDQYFSAHPMN